MLNVIILQGRLAADPESRVSQSGTNLCSFRVAVDRNFTTGGERQTDWINCIAFKNNADFIAKYFGKGDMILLEGSLQTRNYEDKQGQKRTATEVIVNRANFCGKKESTPQQQEQAAQRTMDRAEAAKTWEPEPVVGGDMEDLPF